jgi:hypothetical protein
MEPLTSASASASPSEPAAYRPISALAVAALLVGTLTALLLVGFGISAAATHRPFISPFMMLLAITSLGLAVAAKIQLARSQGTRAGSSLANFSLFLSLITSLGYMAYWFAIDLSVRQQSTAVAEKWLDYLQKNKPELAFRLTRDPGQQKSIPEEADAIRRRFGNVDLSLFTRSDIPRLFRTWPDQSEVSFDGVHNWETTGNGLQAELNFSLRFPEGIYPITVTTLGSDDPDTGSRVWQVSFHTTGLKKNEQRLTTLGKLIYELQFKSVRELKPSYDRFREGGAEKAESFIRLDGSLPPPDKRKQMAAELVQPDHVNLYPGAQMMAHAAPMVKISDQGVFVWNDLEVNLTSVGSDDSGVSNAILVQKVKPDELVKEMQRLVGPNWKQEPLDTTTDLALPKYPVEFEPIELNVRPGVPRVTARPGPPERTSGVPGK